jgi:hemoglobin
MRASWIALSAALLALAFCPPAKAEGTLYDRLGQKAGITRIVEATVSIWLADDRVKADFDNINLDRLKSRIADQICQLADGPCAYKGRPMAASHKGLHLNQAKFNAVAEDLQAAMEQAGIGYWTQNRLMALLAPMQRDIVTR